MRRMLCLGFALVLLPVANVEAGGSRVPAPRFEDVTRQTGLSVSHISSPEASIVDPPQNPELRRDPQ